LHSSHICLSWYKNEKKEEVNDLVVKLEEIFDQIITTYTENEADYIFNIYKKQIDYQRQESSSSSSSSLIRIQHQLQLGLIDSLIEHSFYKKNFK
jgi:uncharacterized protein YdaT